MIYGWGGRTIILRASWCVLMLIRTVVEFMRVQKGRSRQAPLKKSGIGTQRHHAWRKLVVDSQNNSGASSVSTVTDVQHMVTDRNQRNEAF